MATAYMACGHAATGRRADGTPVCVVCSMVDPAKAQTVAPPPDLTGRIAHCGYGKHAPKPSSVELAFFEHHPDREHDTYYCGCYGWD